MFPGFLWVNAISQGTNIRWGEWMDTEVKSFERGDPLKFISRKKADQTESSSLPCEFSGWPHRGEKLLMLSVCYCLLPLFLSCSDWPCTSQANYGQTGPPAGELGQGRASYPKLKGLSRDDVSEVTVIWTTTTKKMRDSDLEIEDRNNWEKPQTSGFSQRCLC